MQDALNQPLLVGKTITADQYLALVDKRKNHEYVIYGDNTLECLTLLNPLVDPSTPLNFLALVHLPLDQPIYVFELQNLELVSVKVCGSYTNWNLPAPVAEIVFKYDLPDFVVYSIGDNKVIFAGELTETASVGNSQWQRELRKIAAAELKVPFIYQTVYSGKDDSQDTIREPTSLLVYNALLYTIRHQTSSQVLFIEPNTDESRTRVRDNPLDSFAISELLAGYLIENSISNPELRIKVSKIIYTKMLEYLDEPKYKAGGSYGNSSRIKVDYPCVPESVYESLLAEKIEFVELLHEYLAGDTSRVADFLKQYPLAEINGSKMATWNDKRSTDYIRDVYDFLEKKNLDMPLAPLAKFSVGIFKTEDIIDYLMSKCTGQNQDLINKIKRYKETLIVPVLLHKKKYGELQYCKDPYAGNTAAFSELLGYDTAGSRARAVIAFCVSENPPNFDIHVKYATNLYRSIAKYSDGIILDSTHVVAEFKPYIQEYEGNRFSNLLQIEPTNATEDSALTSTYVQLTNCIGGWRVCMIAIHHSSWQQIRIRDSLGELVSAKIGRNDSKVDLVLQDDSNIFLAAEGKRSYANFFSSEREKTKIKDAFNNVYATIDRLFGSKLNQKVTSLICLLDVPDAKSDFFLAQERAKITESIRQGHISELTDGEFVIIGIYVLKNQTHFELFFSPTFMPQLKKQLTESFTS